jgi:hypothetical protein
MNATWLLPQKISIARHSTMFRTCRIGLAMQWRELRPALDSALDAEALFNGSHPIILNGIESIVLKGDLADRAVKLVLKTIDEDNRKTEEEFWKDFELAYPRILGALLDGVACGLRELPNTRLSNKPRMADFAL